MVKENKTNEKKEADSQQIYRTNNANVLNPERFKMLNNRFKNVASEDNFIAKVLSEQFTSESLKELIG